MEEIIKSGQYKLVAIFASIWESTGEWGDESIFEINYFSTGGKRAWANSLADGVPFIPNLLVSTILQAVLIMLLLGFEPVRKETYAMYEDNDQRGMVVFSILPLMQLKPVQLMFHAIRIKVLHEEISSQGWRQCWSIRRC